MRLVVLYDLPVVSRVHKKAYVRFHKFLLRDGYDMVQYSVYARICNGQDAINKHVARLKANLPNDGCVRCMQVTEKQFADILVLVGEKKKKENQKYANQLTFF
ncbi:CRISPR-associated endonuclease Cas2 [bacterium]|nr:CRISPR-associated endonuclease Cas2 [bacterium]